MKFKDYLRKLNRMKIGVFANKGKSNDINFLSLKIISRTLAKQKYFITNQVIISCYQEEWINGTVKQGKFT